MYMRKLWSGIKLGFTEWVETLAPEQYIKFAGILIKIVFVLIIARIVIKLGNALISNFFKRRQETRFSMDEKKAIP